VKTNLVTLVVLALGAYGCNAGGSVSSPTISGSDAVDADALSADNCPTGVAAALVPPADQKLKYKFHATGYQVYVCTPNAAGTFGWLNVNPVANLYKPDDTDNDELQGTHFIGPTWQARDNSNVMAAKLAAATPDATAIPWLLLKATSNLGPGKLAEVTYVQRLSTTAGLAAGTCSAANAGTIQKSSYTADYFFYVQGSTTRSNPQCNQ